jgi:predicted RNase H-like HicB family nuclease
MTREYLVVYERGASNWSAFSPDVPGCGSMGDALEDTRTNMRAALELYMIQTAKAGESLPEPKATSIDFEEFDPGHETKHYVVEWLSVALPHPSSSRDTQAA